MMKKLSILVLSFVLIAGFTQAQSKQKFGHINTGELLQTMPERAEAEKAIQEEAKQLEKQLSTMSAEYQAKVQDYQANEATWSQLIKDTKVKEIGDLETRIQEFQGTAQENLQKRESELLQPIVEKAKKAIEDVAAAEGYTYVYDTSQGVLIVFPDGDDLMGKVKTKLGM